MAGDLLSMASKRGLLYSWDTSCKITSPQQSMLAPLCRSRRTRSFFSASTAACNGLPQRPPHSVDRSSLARVAGFALDAEYCSAWSVVLRSGRADFWSTVSARV